MKKCILLLCVLLLAGCAETYDGPTVEQPMLTEHLITYYYSFSGWEEEQSTSRMVYAYDINGNRVRKLDYTDEELTSETKMRYDDRGNQISAVYWDHTGWIPVIERRIEQTYDDQDRLTSYISYDAWGREESRSTYTYDDEANTMTWSDGEGGQSIDYYDENGRTIRSVSESGGITYATDYIYDDRGNRTGMTSWEDGEISGIYQSRFDEKNRLIWSARYDPGFHLISETRYTYDDEANTMTQTRSDGGKRVEYYHPDGRRDRIEDYHADGSLSMVQTYTYRDIQVPANAEEG